MAKIFLIENDPSTTYAVVEALKNPGGHEVKIGSQARQSLREIVVWRPELVIVDWDIDKGWVCERMKEISFLKDIPVIFTFPKSLHISEEDVLHIFQADHGADNYLAKPFTVDSLMRKVELHLALAAT